MIIIDPGALTNEAVRGYKQHLLDQAAKPKTINRRLAALTAYAHWPGTDPPLQASLNP